MESSLCHGAEGRSFFDLKRTWYRLLKDIFIQQKDERRLLSCAFERYTARVFDNVARNHWNATANELRDHLEARLCNNAQLSALQDKFFDMKWNDRYESGYAFGERIRSAYMT